PGSCPPLGRCRRCTRAAAYRRKRLWPRRGGRAQPSSLQGNAAELPAGHSRLPFWYCHLSSGCRRYRGVSWPCLFLRECCAPQIPRQFGAEEHTSRLCPYAHHHLEDVLQALFVHLVRLIHIFNVEVQAVGHHAARINEPALLECHHIFDVGSRVATASTRGRDDGRLLIHPGAGVYRDDVAALDTKNNHGAELAYEAEDGVQGLRIARSF